MSAYAYLLLVALTCAAQGATVPQIVGGRDAPVGKYPYQVSLRNNNNHLCGGSIISSRTILTAAHCLDRASINVLRVHAGTNFLNQTGEVYAPANFTIHKNYSFSELINDIGLITLKTPIKFNTKVQPIKLTTVDYDIGPCKLTGWGTTRLGGRPPNNLQEIDLALYPNVKCKTKHAEVRQSHICTFTKSGEGACHGDSGGPLVVNDVQVGIVSFGQPCAIGYPDVYTRTYAFRDWIAKNRND